MWIIFQTSFTPYSMDCVFQVRTPSCLPELGSIKPTKCRAVCHQDVGVTWYLVEGK